MDFRLDRASAPWPGAMMNLSPTLILLVEDDRNDAELASRLLSQNGHRVVWTIHGRDALDWIRENPLPDAIVLDVAMPVMDGAAFRARQLAHPRWRHIPVIVTGDAFRDGALRWLAGAPLVPKPLIAAELLRALDVCTLARAA